MLSLISDINRAYNTISPRIRHDDGPLMASDNIDYQCPMISPIFLVLCHLRGGIARVGATWGRHTPGAPPPPASPSPTNWGRVFS